MKSRVPRHAALSRFIYLTCCAILPLACSPVGDFGRLESSILTGSIPDQVAVRDASGAGLVSRYELTQDERGLRQRGYRFRTAVAGILPYDTPYDSDRDYAEELTHRGFAWGPARVGTMIGELELDHAELGHFGLYAHRVLVADRNRALALGTDRDYTRDDRVDTLARVRENRIFIDATIKDMWKRIASYRYAIKRARLEAPATSLKRAIRLLRYLEKRTREMEATFLPEAQTVARSAPVGPTVPRVDGPVSLMPKMLRKSTPPGSAMADK